MEAELKRKRKKAILTTGSMSDPYLHLESELHVTEQALALIAKYGFGISVLTKNAMIERDLDWYRKINQNYKALVQMTITTTDDEIAKKIEPNVSLPSERLSTLRRFSEAGITTGIWMTPILPFITDTEANIVSIVESAKAAGVKYIVQFGFATTMREGSREHFYSELDKHFPGLRKQYEMTFRNQYICPSPKASQLQNVFQQACLEAGILFKPQDIHNLFQSNIQQVSLFE